jgi:uncharacterized protein YbaR (Trm112 family)
MIPPHSRFWASIEYFRACCPRCQSYILILPPNRNRAQMATDRKWYDRTHQILMCRRCKSVYQVGLLLYPGVRRPSPVPGDVQLTRREMAELRNLQAGGYWLRDPAARVLTPGGIVEIPAVNLALAEPCTCPPLPWRASCGVHGAGQVGPELTD